MSVFNRNEQHVSDEEMRNHERLLVMLARASSGVLSILLVVFFVVVIKSTSTINSQVEYVKESPYPISVAAGHMETDLVQLQTFIEDVSISEIAMDAESKQEGQNTLIKIFSDLDDQLIVVEDSARPGDIEVERVRKLIDLLKERTEVFFKMRWSGDHDQNSYESLATYANSYLDPVINLLLKMNSDALESTRDRVETMYTEVNNSVFVLLWFSIITSVVIIGVSVLLIIVIKVRGKLEKQLRANLTEALEETNQANQAKSAFLANMSHDIRTPMNAIVGLTQIAIENIDDPIRVRQCLTRITTSSQHLLSLINDVLDMNKIESGKVTLSKEVFSIERLANEMDTLFQSQTDSKRRKSEVIVKNIYADMLVGDTMRLRQILLNLISNALKYTNEGDTARLIIEEKPCTIPKKANVVFIVEDTGIGMEEEFISRIFEPFERESNDFTIFTEGTGLGMAITKNLVDLMGGTIQVESDLGIGTKVTINIEFEIAKDSSLPSSTGSFANMLSENRYFSEASQDEWRADTTAVESARTQNSVIDAKEVGDSKKAHEEQAINAGGKSGEDGADASGSGQSAAASKPSSSSKTKLNINGNVLIVEDNEINMEIAKQLIGSRGASTDEAYDGLEAVNKVKNSKEGDYDLIFMDWQMPHMNGIEATQAIREYLEENGLTQIPIVAMTANAFDSDKKTALEAGMNDFMSKPINIHQLEDVLIKYLS